MPSLRNILHKRDDLSINTSTANPPPMTPPPEFTFIRSDTFGEEVITPPSHADDPPFSPRSPSDSLDSPRTSTSTSRRSFQLFSRNRASRSDSLSSPSSPRREHRISNLLHRDGGRSRSNSHDLSVNLPEDLPQIADDALDKEEREALWEKRATVLARHRPALGSPLQSEFDFSGEWGGQSRSSSRSRAGELQDDANIQEAIRLHESGDLERSTQMFGQLADRNGANNPLSQVLYGLALRHGWGCTEDRNQAYTYLKTAADNAAAVESEALRAGMKKGGSAKGELVLAIFELANCYRYGWGVEVDAVAARKHYETAANLGDTDAMNEAAWCYIKGFGQEKGKKRDKDEDKRMAAKYYRLAEKNGCPTVGNSWIWKEKWDEKPAHNRA
ncbi:hypothetical protein N7490_005426 [Penicillium lividum]|nr:hypothetical protein N7490_005426 [Penicillium lividum]